MSRIDYELKSRLIGSFMLEDYKKVSKSLYNEYVEKVLGVVSDNEHDMYITKAKELWHMYNKLYPKEWKECARISNAHRNRVLRLKKRIADILLFGDCIFLTFTFTDETFNRRNADSRKQAVKKYLTSLDCPYVANIDFGKKNGREHYHAVVGIDKVDYSKWKYGALNGLKIRNQTEDLTRIAKYIAKLTNHAIKETTKRSVIMYSRKKFEVNKNGL